MVLPVPPPKENEAFSGGKSLGPIALLAIGGGFYLRVDAAHAFGRLRRKAASEDVFLVVDDAFRTMQEQERLWARHQSGELKTPVARPGWSKHQSGVALDIAVHRTQESAEYLWLAANAPALGWTNPGAHFHPPEYWHWEFSPPKESP